MNWRKHSWPIDADAGEAAREREIDFTCLFAVIKRRRYDDGRVYPSLVYPGRRSLPAGRRSLLLNGPVKLSTGCPRDGLLIRIYQSGGMQFRDGQYTFCSLRSQITLHVINRRRRVARGFHA